MDTLTRFSTMFYKIDNFVTSICYSEHTPSEKGSVLKEKEFAPNRSMRINSIILEKTHFQMGGKNQLDRADSLEIVSGFMFHTLCHH